MQPSDSIHILLADDHSLIRHGLQIYLQKSVTGVTISETDSFDGVIAILARQAVQLIFLDISMPGGERISMIDVIRLKQPDAKIIVYSAYQEEIYAPMYLQAGANGYVMKTVALREILRAYHTVMAGEVYISDQVKQHLLTQLNKKSAGTYGSISNLSVRETEVAQLLVQGDSLSEIAAKLSLQANTVSTYKSRIFEKMGVTNVVELVNKYRTLEQ
ncbi:response regulator [Deminuibacter soli]|uniref:DNA-binding response regulator n=1 Tax=Deminuibacter soli TaxID=2291815 RepID=A0A3E1NE89_9BACT|nr:response regulator transcription factor [Deminuibacter soli]RFM26280.1 DNA-binding response regulator [Deminuibacter soli]